MTRKEQQVTRTIFRQRLQRAARSRQRKDELRRRIEATRSREQRSSK